MMNKLLIVPTLCLISFSNFINAQIDTSEIEKDYKLVQHVRYVEPTYEYIPIKENYITDVALGLEYNNESFNGLGPESWDSLGQLKNSSGFDFYFLFSALPKNMAKNWGNINWGLGMGFNQFSNGDRYNVALNTIREDSAFTQVKNNTFHLYSILRYEFQLGRFYPFLGMQGGVSFYNSNQHTETYVPITDYESIGTADIHNSVAGYLSTEIGLRFRLNTGVNMYVSYIDKRGSDLEIIDVENSTFNGLSFNGELRDVKYNTNQWKIGFLFDLSTNKYEKRKIKEGYYDTSIVIQSLNQPCPPCPCEEDEDSQDNGTSIFRGSNSSPSRTNNSPATISPKSFPGVKPPAPPSKPKS